MLVFTRKTDQFIWIEGGVWIRVLGIEHRRVKFGIVAPEELHVLRGELTDGWLEREEHEGSAPR